MKTVKLNGRYITWDNSNNKKGTKTRKPKKKYPFIKIIQRRRNGLLKLLHGLTKDPRSLITLIYPKKFSDVRVSNRIKTDLNQLASNIRRGYKKSWWIYSIEWSPKSGLHIHLIGRFKGTQNIARQQMQMWWWRIIGSSQANLADIRFLKTPEDRAAAVGYLSKGEKKRFIGQAILLLGTQYTYGRLNKKNFPITRQLKFNLSDQQFDKLRSQLISEHRKNGRKIRKGLRDQHLTDLTYANSGFHILNKNPKKIEAFLKRNAEEVQ